MELKNQIAKWIKMKVKEANAKGVVLGLSGGLDSAVVAVLCKQALGDNVRGFIMPCSSLSADEKDAYLVADKFNIEIWRRDLYPTYKALIYECTSDFPEELGNKSVLGNIKARLRMTTLYMHANLSNYLVCGTTNKSEMMIGYFTKYGDGASDIEPIADLYKTEVFELAKELGIPEKIINKKPSAGLWEGQTDENEIGMAYEELDGVLEYIIQPDRIIQEDGKLPKVSSKLGIKVLDMYKKTEHKRKIPDIFRR